MLSAVFSRVAHNLQLDPTAARATAMAFVVVAVVLSLLSIAGRWGTFRKAGEYGWKACIPFLDQYTAFEIAWPSQMWLFWVWLIALVGEIVFSGSVFGTPNRILASICLVVWALVHACLSLALAKSFGRGNGFAGGLWALDSVFSPVLGFGPAQYKGPADALELVPIDELSEEEYAAYVGEYELAQEDGVEPLDAESVETEFVAKPVEAELTAESVETELDAQPAETELDAEPAQSDELSQDSPAE